MGKALTSKAGEKLENIWKMQKGTLGRTPKAWEYTFIYC